jgi:hypothetical protein
VAGAGPEPAAGKAQAVPGATKSWLQVGREAKKPFKFNTLEPF